MFENRFKLRAKANGSWTLGNDHNRRITQRLSCLLFAFTHPQDNDVYEQRVVKERLTLCDILRTYPDLSLPAVILLTYGPPLKPRYYSISSSPLQSPGEVHITAAVVKYSTKLSTGENDDDLDEVNEIHRFTFYSCLFNNAWKPYAGSCACSWLWLTEK